MTRAPALGLGALWLLLAALLAVGCETETVEDMPCTAKADCAKGMLCTAGLCQPGCEVDGDCPVGFCVDGQCRLQPPDPCDCLPTSACTATAPECQVVHPDEPCTRDEHCSDGLPCSVDTCVEGACRHVASDGEGCCTTGDECADEDPCTTDRCQGFRCDHTYRLRCCDEDTDCSDGDPCTRDWCDEGACLNDLPNPECCREDAKCDDLDACTTDRCVEGLCVRSVTGAAVECACHGTGECADGNPCTIDRCLDNVCSYLPAPPASDPGRCCASENDCPPPADGYFAVCEESLCTQRPFEPCEDQTDCDDDDACTIDGCRGATCEHVVVPYSGCCNVDADCPIENACTEVHCSSSRCVANSLALPGCCTDARDCVDDWECTTDTCRAFTCLHTAARDECCVEEADCDDQNTCTLDSCGEDHVCRHDVDPRCCRSSDDCNDGDPCTEDRCFENTCENMAIPSCCYRSEECEDEDPCTETTCVQNRCRIAYLSGCCSSDAFCWDGDACTVDACDAGACQFTRRDECCLADAECTTADPCLEGRCVANACVLTAVPECCDEPADCDDGDDVCTVDACVDSRCTHVSTGVRGCCRSTLDCVSSDPCAAPICHPDGSCSYVPRAGCCLSAAQCDDDDFCTDDACTAEHACAHTFNGAEGCCSTWTYIQGFDRGGTLLDFTLENSDARSGWQVDAHRVHDGGGALYYGHPPWYEYDGVDGAASSGRATSPTLSLPARQPYRLRAYVLVDVRRDLALDRFEIRVLPQDGVAAVVWSRDDLADLGGVTGPSYFPIDVSLAAWTGRAIRIELAFDTVTPPSSTFSDREGVYVDSLALVGHCP